LVQASSTCIRKKAIARSGSVITTGSFVRSSTAFEYGVLTLGSTMSM
jgi:hypothetical protein